MRSLLILTAIFIFIQSCTEKKAKDFSSNPGDIIKVRPPSGLSPSVGLRLYVSLAADNTISVGDKKLPMKDLDSLLGIEINKIRPSIYDTVTIVLHADSATDYGVVFKVMRAVKKQNVKIVTTVDSQ